jgi:hypothetical protein
MTINYKGILNIFLFYFIWVVLHYLASHIYIYLCVPIGFYGFITSIFTNQLPYCRGLRYMVTVGSEQISDMWILLGTFIISLFSLLKV